MHWRGFGLVACFLAGTGYAVFHAWPRTPTVSELDEQLSGTHCRFIFEANQCKMRGLNPLRALLTTSHDCDLWAISCLKQFHSPDAIQVAITVLHKKTDIETCDGVLPIRSYAVSYLAENGDDTAIEPLERLLKSNPTSKLSVGASGCVARPEDTDEITRALDKLRD